MIRIRGQQGGPLQPRYFLLFFLSARAAAFIRATCMAEKPPAVVSQSLPGLAPHWVQGKDIGLTGRISGIEGLAFAIVQSGTLCLGIDTTVRSISFSGSAAGRRCIA